VVKKVRAKQRSRNKYLLELEIFNKTIKINQVNALKDTCMLAHSAAVNPVKTLNPQNRQRKLPTCCHYWRWYWWSYSCCCLFTSLIPLQYLNAITTLKPDLKATGLQQASKAIEGLGMFIK
jgi:hypothetical protein